MPFRQLVVALCLVAFARAGSNREIKVNEYTWDRATDNMPSSCLYELSDLGTIVPDECCDSAIATKVDEFSSSKGQFCTPRRQTSGLYVRDWIGCYADSFGVKVPTLAEACIPAEYAGGYYPMSESNATADGVQGDYTVSECRSDSSREFDLYFFSCADIE